MECERFRCPLLNNWQYILDRTVVQSASAHKGWETEEIVHMLTVCQKTGKYGVYTSSSDGVFFKGWFSRRKKASQHYAKVVIS